MQEILNLRTENTKTFDLGDGKRRLEAHIGAIHYRENYEDKSEFWKEINLDWENNRITKAPYELTLDGSKLTLKDKKTGDVSTIELFDIKPPGLKWEIIPENSAVRFRHILPSDKIPFEAEFKVTGKNILTRAFDDEGELELETSLVDGILTEKLFEVKDKQTGQVRPAKGNIKVDPTWQVGAVTDDCVRNYVNTSYWVTPALLYAGYISATYSGLGSASRFLNVTIPAGSTITLAQLKLVCYVTDTETVVNNRLRAEANINPLTFSTKEDFDARVWTTHIHWDALPAWTLNEEYISPDIKACIQEVINLPGWASGNPMVVLRDDFELQSDQVSNHLRTAYDFADSSTKAAKLYVEYTEAVTTSKKPTRRLDPKPRTRVGFYPTLKLG